MYDFNHSNYVVNCLGAKTKKWLILGVSFTHLVQSRDPFFCEAEIVDNIFQWDVPENMQQIKNYDDVFQARRALTIQKILVSYRDYFADFLLSFD